MLLCDGSPQTPSFAAGALGTEVVDILNVCSSIFEVVEDEMVRRQGGSFGCRRCSQKEKVQ